MCDEKCHSWDITEPIIWLWKDLPYPRPDLLCNCGKRELGIERAKKYAIKGSLYAVKTPNTACSGLAPAGASDGQISSGASR